MLTIERLEQYWPFDEAVTSAIQETAVRQNSRTFHELADEYGVSGGPHRDRPYMYSNRILEYLDFTPGEDYDRSHARVLFAPMGIPVDASMAMRSIRFFGAQPDERLLVVGSPSIVGVRTNRMRLQDCHQVWSGNLTAAIKPVLQHLENQNITHIDTLGYSYGADAAAAAAVVAHDHGIEMKSGVWAEPTAVKQRSLPNLAAAFFKSGKPLGDYVAATESQPLFEARELADKGFSRYALGLLRASNIAIAHSLATDHFQKRAFSALSQQPGLRAAIAWGTASELTDNQSMEAILEPIRSHHIGNRVTAMALEGMHHAGGDDIDLHAAIMIQGLRLTHQLMD